MKIGEYLKLLRIAVASPAATIAEPPRNRKERRWMKKAKCRKDVKP